MPPELFDLLSMASSLLQLKILFSKSIYYVRLNAQIESKFILSTRLTVEGPLRMKEEYAEGIFETPKVIEETVPDQLKGAFGQAASTIQQLPVPVRDAFTGGLKFPLSKKFFLSLCDHLPC